MKAQDTARLQQSLQASVVDELGLKTQQVGSVLSMCQSDLRRPPSVQAADDGVAISQFQLATYYMHGIHGYAKDLATAEVWLRRAAKQNVGPAYCILGKWRASGVVGLRDLRFAVSLYKLEKPGV